MGNPLYKPEFWIPIGAPNQSNCNQQNTPACLLMQNLLVLNACRKHLEVITFTLIRGLGIKRLDQLQWGFWFICVFKVVAYFLILEYKDLMVNNLQQFLLKPGTAIFNNQKQNKLVNCKSVSKSLVMIKAHKSVLSLEKSLPFCNVLLSGFYLTGDIDL